MAIRVVAVTAHRNDPLLASAERYLSRSGRRMGATLIVVRSEKRKKGADDALVRRKEGEALLAASEGCTRVALDAAGKLQDTPAFARSLEALLLRGRDVAFLIGGATGLSDEVRRAADAVWSLSPLTLPHRLALLVLCEQVFRAAELARGGPYAK